MVKNLPATRETRVRKIPGEGDGNPLQCSCLENPGLVGCSPWGHRELHTAERLTFHFPPKALPLWLAAAREGARHRDWGRHTASASFSALSHQPRSRNTSNVTGTACPPRLPPPQTPDDWAPWVKSPLHAGAETPGSPHKSKVARAEPCCNFKAESVGSSCSPAQQNSSSGLSARPLSLRAQGVSERDRKAWLHAPASRSAPTLLTPADFNKGDIHITNSLMRDKLYFDISEIARQ